MTNKKLCNKCEHYNNEDDFCDLHEMSLDNFIAQDGICDKNDEMANNG